MSHFQFAKTLRQSSFSEDCFFFSLPLADRRRQKASDDDSKINIPYHKVRQRQCTLIALCRCIVATGQNTQLISCKVVLASEETQAAYWAAAGGASEITAEEKWDKQIDR